MAKQKTETKREYTVRYVPDQVRRSIAGAKGPKSYPRPFLFDVQTYMINTQDDGTKVNTYLLFGGVPSENLHNNLIEAGFKVRRRARSWDKKKDGKVVETVNIADRDNECYAVYYTLEPVTEEQATIIGKLFLATGNVAASGKTFLAPNWKTVAKLWGDKDDWLTVCSVEPEEENDTPAPAPEEDDDSIDLNSSEIDDLI
jgi:hypothetical protein